MKRTNIIFAKANGRRTMCGILLAVLMLTAQTVRAQEIKMNEESINDYLPLLHVKGYRAYSFDTSQLGKGLHFRPIIKEYENGELKNENLAMFGFDISFPLTDKLIIGLSPEKSDSLKTYTFDSNGSMVSGRLVLHPIPQPNDKVEYGYDTRLFDIKSFSKGAFIPLVLYGSYWYDKDIEMTRFCDVAGDEKYINPDMASKILKYIPHYFVIGIIIE